RIRRNLLCLLPLPLKHLFRIPDPPPLRDGPPGPQDGPAPIRPTVKHRCQVCTPTLRDPDQQPAFPCLTLILWSPPAWVPSENAATGPRHVLFPTPLYGARGALRSYLPPAVCRARSRKVWHDHRKYMKRRRRRILQRSR
ncbi:early protein E4, partial [Camelus dromedarius papillomavirus 3]